MKARDNPFRTERVLQFRYQLAEAEWEDLFRRFARLKFRAALVGPKGSGKTTLLEDFVPRLLARGYETRFLRLSEENPNLPGTLAWPRRGSREILLVDGAEQLGFFAWQRFRHLAREAAGWLITIHRPGRLPTLRDCHTSPELLSEIATTLLGRRDEAIDRKAARLFKEHSGNVREALRAWYDDYAIVAAVCDRR